MSKGFLYILDISQKKLGNLWLIHNKCMKNGENFLVDYAEIFLYTIMIDEPKNTFYS